MVEAKRKAPKGQYLEAKRGRWKVMVWHGGKPEMTHFPIGTPETERSDWQRRTLARLKRAAMSATEDAAAGIKRSFAEDVAVYFVREVEVKAQYPADAAKRKSALLPWIDAAGSRGRLDMTEYDWLKTYQDLARRLADNTLNRYRGELVAFYSWASRFYGTTYNPARALPRRDPELEPKAISWDTVEAILEALPNRTPVEQRDRALLVLMAWTGMRPCEVSRMKETDFSDGPFPMLYIRTGKRGAKRTSQLVPPAAAAVRVWWSLPNRKVATGCYGRQWHIACSKVLPAGMRHPVPYALRHTHGTKLMELSKGNVKAVMAMMGHKTMSMCDRYTAGAVAGLVLEVHQQMATAHGFAAPSAAQTFRVIRSEQKAG